MPSSRLSTQNFSVVCMEIFFFLPCISWSWHCFVLFFFSGVCLFLFYITNLFLIFCVFMGFFCVQIYVSLYLYLFLMFSPLWPLFPICLFCSILVCLLLLFSCLKREERVWILVGREHGRAWGKKTTNQEKSIFNRN